MPEFIAGTQRQPGDGPTHTPRADPLQAWSAAAVPFMVTELLGLDADGFAGRLYVRQPLLPDGVDGLVLHEFGRPPGPPPFGLPVAARPWIPR